MEAIKEESEDTSDPEPCRVKYEDTEELRDLTEEEIRRLNEAVENDHKYQKPHNFLTGETHVGCPQTDSLHKITQKNSTQISQLHCVERVSHVQYNLRIT